MWGWEGLAYGVAQRQEDIPLDLLGEKHRNKWVYTPQLISVYESGWCPAGNGSRAPETSGRKWLRSVLLLSTGSLPPPLPLTVFSFPSLSLLHLLA